MSNVDTAKIAKDRLLALQDKPVYVDKDPKGEAMINGYGCTKEQYDMWITAPLEKQLALELEWGFLWRESYPSNPIEPVPEYTGGSVGYYSIEVTNPTTEGRPPYIAECNDIIEALKLNYAEGNVIKAIWRRAAAELGKSKEGYKDGLYDAEKVEFFGHRLVVQESK